MTGKGKQVAAQSAGANAMTTSTVSERFTGLVLKEFTGSAGLVKFTPYQKKLTQHMFIKIDASLKDLEAKRISKNMNVAPYDWNNINMEKLAIDTVHRVELGLDALIPNHISPVPYFNKKKQKYDLDLRVGYTGKSYYRSNMSIGVVLNIIYELVYETDKFIPLKKGHDRQYDQYEFEITEPFNRGEIIGGFGYIIYENQDDNKLVIVTEADFVKSKNLAKSQDFWSKHPVKMRMKTLVHRVSEELNIDPLKVNSSFFKVEAESDDLQGDEMNLIEHSQNEVSQQANKTTIDIEPDPPPEPKPDPDPPAAPEDDGDDDEPFEGNDDPGEDGDIPDKPGFG